MILATITATLAILSAWLLMRPMYEQSIASPTDGRNERERLVVERERLFGLMVELEESKAAQKISAAEYETEKSQLGNLTAECLRKLDALGNES